MRTKVRAAFGIAVLVFSLLNVAVPRALAVTDTCTWTGTTSSNWSVGSNWSGCDNGGVPQAGDSLVFPASTSNMAMNNDLSLIFNEITFDGGGYTVSGNAVNVSQALNVYAAVSFVSAVTFTASSGNLVLSYQDPAAILPSNITLNLTGTANFQLFSTVDNLPIPSFSGTVNKFSVIGAATGGQRNFIATSDSTFVASGGVTLARATFLCETNNCLGDSSNMVSITNGNSRGAELNLWTNNLTIPYDISLDDLGFDGPATLSATGSGETLTGNINIGSNSNIRVSGGHTLTINGSSKTVTIPSGKTLTFVGSDYNDKVVLQNPVTGGGVFNVVGSTVTASGDNASFDGNIIVNDGGVYDGGAATLGTTTGETSIGSGGTWVLNNASNETINDHVVLDGDGGAYAPASMLVKNHDVTFANFISLGSDTTVDNTSTTGATVAFNSNIVGPGGLILAHSSGNSANNYSLAADNTFDGDVTVKGTSLTLDGNGTNVPHNLSIQATSSSNASVTANAASVLSSSSVITTAKNGSHTASLLVNTPATSVSMVTGDGTIGFLSTGQDLQVGNNNASGTFSGTLSGTGNTITKVGTGTWSLNSASYASGSDSTTFVINGGTISFNGALAGSPVTVGSGSTLKGTGTIGATTIQSGATVAIGNSPGCMTMSSLGMASGSTYQQQIAGATACSEYDQVTVTGNANLGSANLNVDLTYTPATGTSFTIIKAGSVTGTFNGLQDGATIVVNGVTLRINYTATAVTLTYVSGTATSILTNTGLSLIGPAGVAIVLIAAAIYVARRRKPYAFAGCGIIVSGMRAIQSRHR